MQWRAFPLSIFSICYDLNRRIPHVAAALFAEDDDPEVGRLCDAIRNGEAVSTFEIGRAVGDQAAAIDVVADAVAIGIAERIEGLFVVAGHLGRNLATGEVDRRR